MAPRFIGRTRCGVARRSSAPIGAPYGESAIGDYADRKSEKLIRIRTIAKCCGKTEFSQQGVKVAAFLQNFKVLLIFIFLKNFIY